MAETLLSTAASGTGKQVAKNREGGTLFFFFFFVTLGLELSDTTSLRALHTSPPRNCCLRRQATLENSHAPNVETMSLTFTNVSRAALEATQGQMDGYFI